MNEERERLDLIRLNHDRQKQKEDEERCQQKLKLKQMLTQFDEIKE